jgi:hypothetical protein
MAITRQVFEYLAAAGSGAAGGGSGITARTDTGPTVTGFLHQIKWESLGSADSGAPDTGADLQIFAQQREADTGDGVLVLNDNDILSADRLWLPRKVISLDTGDSTASATNPNFDAVPFVNERPRVRIVPGSAGVRGRLYLWFKG